ncbi:unnamed protein product [Zymoseptoria tritici ST99CH_3D7]|uniref:BTB domain-containing protein n=2 Tax=Zymoseptoria tritici TaxID=1047171 RepID=A0A1X7RPA1_ZYMT9|nr:unnamed protein product [Zymoseptoria tritici ST99CH_3D7]
MAVEAPTVTGSRFSGPLVTFKVGAQSDAIATFTVHENLIRDGHDFFHAAMDKRWKEGQRHEIELPDDQPEVIGSFIEWLYTEKIAVTSTHLLQNEDSDKQYIRLAHLYVFGEKVQSVAFRNAVLSAILMARDGAGTITSTYSPIREAVRVIYSGTVAGSPARKLMVHIHVETGHSDWFGKDATLHCPEFLFDIAIALMDKRPRIALRLYDTREEWFIQG